MMGFILLALAHGHRGEVYFASGLIGIAPGLGIATMASLVPRAVRQGQVGVTAAVMIVSGTVGGALGAEVVASALSAHVQRFDKSAQRGGALIRVAGVLAAAMAALRAGRSCRAQALLLQSAESVTQPQLGWRRSVPPAHDTSPGSLDRLSRRAGECCQTRWMPRRLSCPADQPWDSDRDPSSSSRPGSSRLSVELLTTAR